MEKFLELLAEIFEVETEKINMDTVFRDEIEYFTSLMGFSIIVMIEDEYNKQMTTQEFLNCNTIRDLYDYCVS